MLQKKEKLTRQQIFDKVNSFTPIQTESPGEMSIQIAKTYIKNERRENEICIQYDTVNEECKLKETIIMLTKKQAQTLAKRLDLLASMIETKKSKHNG